MKSPSAPVILLGAAEDPHILAVARHLADLRVDARVLDGHDLSRGAPFTFRVDGRRVTATLDGVDITRPRGVYVRQLPAPWPPVGTADGEPVVLARWMTPYMHARERDAALRALLLHWHDTGVRMLNPPEGGHFSRNKAHQLATASRVGIRVPPTCITNDADELRDFVARHGVVALKPLDGGALTLRVEGRVPPRVLRSMHVSPLIAQRWVEGQDVRIYVLKDRVLSCAALVLPGRARLADFRASRAYQEGRAAYRAIQLPEVARARVAAWMKACGLVFAGLDARRDARGTLHFLEMNSSPIFMDQEEKTGDAISAALARWLAGRRDAARTAR